MTATMPWLGSSRSDRAALRQLSRSPFFAGVALRALVFDLKQVRRYLLERTARTNQWNFSPG
jgi:hypothetical protein